MNNGLTVLSSL